MAIFFLLLFLVTLVTSQNPPPQAVPSPAATTTTPQPTVKEKISMEKRACDCKNECEDRYDRKKLIMWLVKDNCNPDDENEPESYTQREYPGYDGFYNNLGRPELGAVDTPLLRRTPAAYDDGTYKPAVKNRPNPFTISDELFSQNKFISNNNTMTESGRTALLVFFGQHVVEEILDAQRPACPPEYFNIKIPDDHIYRKSNHSEMPFLRTRYDVRTGQSPGNPRQQLNEITPWIDGGLIYGTSRAWCDYLRRYNNGTPAPPGQLASIENGLFPEKNLDLLPMANPPPPYHHHDFKERHETFRVDRFYKLGNPRGHENPFLLTFGILWFRWHNHIAEVLHEIHTNWTNEQIFNEARKWTIATQQHIIVNNWLPHFLGKEISPYKGYNPSVDPQIDQLFQGAAFRFGHTLVPRGIGMMKKMPSDSHSCELHRPVKSFVRTCNSFWRPEKYIGVIAENYTEDIDPLILGMAHTLSEKEDNIIVEDLRQNVFGPLEFPRRDLMALNIQRGRDHGLPDYNTARKYFGLKPKKKEQLNPELYKVYKNINNIDVWAGGLFESIDINNQSTGTIGELFSEIIKDQFERIRDGDRFWYANINNGLFTEKEVLRIEALTIYDIIITVTKLDPKEISENLFNAPYEAIKCLIESKCPKRINSTITNIPKGKRTCYHLKTMENEFSDYHECKPKIGTYDYFKTSEISFLLTYLFITFGILVIAGIVAFITYKRSSPDGIGLSADRRGSLPLLNNCQFSVLERIGKNSSRSVILTLDKAHRQMKVLNLSGEAIRLIDMGRPNIHVKVYIISDGQHLMFRMCNDYDLLVKFETSYLRSCYLKQFESFVEKVGVKRERINISLTAALRQTVTKKDRQRLLEKFFRVVFAHTFNFSHTNEIFKLDSESAKEIIYMELTITEFAEALSMLPNSEFVTKMFNFVDKDKNGFISFREFMDFLVIFSKGTTEDKAKLMFDMYDINGTQQLTKQDFQNMIRSLIEIVNADVDPNHLNSVVEILLSKAKLINKNVMRYEDFQRVLLQGDQVSNLRLDFNLPRAGDPTNKSRRSPSTFSLYSDLGNLQNEINKEAMEAERIIDEDQENAIGKNKNKDELDYVFNLSKAQSKTRRNFQNHALEIFWLLLYTLVLFAIFAERAYHYSVEREHGGLRRIAGLGVTITRGAASAIMFCLGSLLIPMCRNCVTFLRDTHLHEYIPFDSAIGIHKYIACWTLFFSIVHVIGHSFNFYFISTQTSDDLTCLFRNFYHSSHEIPKFHYWCWGTITGITGILLVFFTALIFLFALPITRNRCYKAFWVTHSLYPIYFGLVILHGTGRLVQPPFFLYFFLGPCILFSLDKIMTLKNKKVEIPVLRSEIHPSGVIMLEVKRPTNFEYKSGQWVRIGCPTINSFEFHPFTFSSAPHEENLTFHIRAVGSWTQSLRNVYDPSNQFNIELPKVILDGPYGEFHQDWNQYEVSVLIGAGIGVTPFASILKEIVFRNNSLSKIGICRKIYFLWVTRTQKQFEWMVDIIREVEIADKQRLISIHIFITQFYNKFDLRTILLYICERRFQRVSNRSLFTGLQAVTHFGRPDFYCFFKSLQTLRPNVKKVGVFSCGPPPLTQAVNIACGLINKESYSGPIFQHLNKHF